MATRWNLLYLLAAKPYHYYAVPQSTHPEDQVQEILNHILGHQTLEGCPHVNRDSLRQKGLRDADIDQMVQDAEKFAEEDKKRRLGDEADKPHRIRYKKLA